MNNPTPSGPASPFEPLREPVFRTIWSASLLSNFGQLILGVGAAWEMTRLSGDPTMVALVQTAMMLPLMLVALPAGAIADMMDRRKVAMFGLAFASASGGVLSAVSMAGLTTPWLLLGFCVLIGAGVALYSPAWQASISEQVSAAHLPAAIALGSVSYNVARSFGPALGGLIVLAAGAQAAFAINAIAYLPLLAAFFFWRRTHAPSRLPPERIDRAIVTGARFALHAAPVRAVLARSFGFGLASASAAAMAPLIARDLLGGDAAVFGLLLGASGVGAVIGALNAARLQHHCGTEAAVRALAVIAGVLVIGVGLSSHLWLSCLLLVAQGAANMLTISLLNVSVQLAAPRWVTARALSLFSSALTGGIAIGAVIWGVVAAQWSVQIALIVSGVVLAASAVLGHLFPLAQHDAAAAAPAEMNSEPDVALHLTMRSGPVVIEIDYRIAPERARDFYDAMRAVQRVRLRNGGFAWSLARDIADPMLWTERFSCPTWGDYLRMRDRYTQADRNAQAQADAMLEPGTAGARVRRRLERPFGSVRWQAGSLDPQRDDIGFVAP
jgi:MFS family permease